MDENIDENMDENMDKNMEDKNMRLNINMRNKMSKKIILENTNHYIYKGKLDDYNNQFLEKSITDEFEHIDYNTFKRDILSEKKTL